MKRFLLSNHSEILFDEERASLLSMKVEGEELLSSAAPFFALRFRSKKAETKTIDSFSFHFLKEEGECFYYEHSDADVSLSFKDEREKISVFISVYNKTSDVLEWIEWGSVSLFGKLKDEGGKGEILTSFNEGAVISSFARREASPFPYLEPNYPSQGKFSIFPNMLCAQFIAYCAEEKGIYLAMEDPERGTKHIDFCAYGESIKLQLRAYSNLNYGESYVSSFPVVIRLFHGDFYDACSFYRDWFEKHLPNGCKKATENPSLPSWYFASPIIAPYPIRGKYDTDEMIPNHFYPYENALPLLKEIGKETDSQIMALLMHWEGTAPWAPPYVYPPFGGVDMFSAFVQKAHKENMLIGLYCSGFGYTLESKLVPEYQKRKEYEEKGLSRYMLADSDGTILSTICTPQRVGYDMCPYCEWVKETFSSEIEKCVSLGADYIQALDQNHGGTGYFCYSDTHGHPPVPGKWQIKAVEDILKRIHHPNSLLGCESGASEPYLGLLLFSDCRFNLNYYFGKPFPLYSFLFHEYLHNFMGNQVCETLSDDDRNYPLRVTYSFLSGDNLAVDLTDEGDVYVSWCNSWQNRKVKREIALSILKNLNAWKKGLGKDYLNFGRMRRPFPYHCSNEERFRCEDGNVLSFPSVLSSSYEIDGKKATFFVNYTSLPQKVSWEGRKTFFLDPYSKEKTMASSLLIEPYMAIMVLE